MFWNSVQAKQSSVRMLRNKQFTNKATNRTRHWYVISHASFARLESVTAMYCKEIKLTFLILFFMIRSAAYTLSPSSILCIPSLVVGKVKNPNPKTLQSKYCDPNHCIRLWAHCNPIHILCHNTLFTLSLFKVAARTILFCGTQQRVLSAQRHSRNWSRGRKPLPRAPRPPHCVPCRQSAPLVRQHPLDIL